MTHNSRVYRSQAIILSRRDHGEADRVITLYTPALGKQEWIAKGARKTTSRKAGHLELFTHATLLIAKARTWDIVTEAATVESFRHLRGDLDIIAQASYVCELITTFTEHDDENVAIWDLLLLGLRVLDEQASLRSSQSSNTSVEQSVSNSTGNQQQQPESYLGDEAAKVDHLNKVVLFLRWFELHLLGMSGFQPQLFTCLQCNKIIEPVTNFLSLEDGGIYCPQCGTGKSDVEPIESHILKILRHLQRTPWQEIQNLSIQPLVLLATENILHRYILTVLERQLKSVTFLRKLKSMMPPVSSSNGSSPSLSSFAH